MDRYHSTCNIHICTVCDNGLTSGQPAIVTDQAFPLVSSTSPTSLPEGGSEGGFSNLNSWFALNTAFSWTVLTIC